MNCRIPEARLRAVCREVLSAGRPLSHRALRAVLRERFGATGKTARVLTIWREERAQFQSTTQPTSQPASNPSLPSDVLELQARLLQAETRAQKLKDRAEVAELREESHSVRWLLEIDKLRQQLQAQPNYAREVRNLQSTVTRLTVELAALRGAWPRNPAGEGGSH